MMLIMMMSTVDVLGVVSAVPCGRIPTQQRRLIRCLELTGADGVRAVYDGGAPHHSDGLCPAPCFDLQSNRFLTESVHARQAA